MKNPFTPNLMQHFEALLRGSGYKEEVVEYAANCINQHDKLEVERDELKRYNDKLPTYCAYCGFEVPIDDETALKISEHIATCPKHPIRHVEVERDRLRDGLTLAMKWLDQVCDPDCEDLRTPEGVEVHDKLAALLKEEK